MNVIHHSPARRPTGRKIAVAERAQRFANAFVVRIEFVIDQRPCGSRLRSDLNFGECADHNVSARLAQCVGLAAEVDADDAAEAPGMPGRDAHDRVLDDHRASGFHLEALRSFEECVRRRLTLEGKPAEIDPIHPSVEQFGDTGCSEHRRTVITRGYDRSLDVQLPQCANQRDCGFVNLDAVLLQRFGEIAVLKLPQPAHGFGARAVFGCSYRQFDLARLQKRSDAVVTRLPVDEAPVIGNDIERHESFARAGGALPEKFIEQFFPRCGVHARRFGQDAVEIEQNGIVIAGGKRDDGSCNAAHDALCRETKSENVIRNSFRTRNSTSENSVPIL